MDNILPNALMIGVNYDLFWTLTPKSLEPFVKAFELKQKYDDRLAWQQGVYIQQAIASVMDKKSKYPKKPFMAKSEDKPMSAEEIKARVMQQAQIINSQLERR